MNRYKCKQENNNKKNNARQGQKENITVKYDYNNNNRNTPNIEIYNIYILWKAEITNPWTLSIITISTRGFQKVKINVTNITKNNFPLRREGKKNLFLKGGRGGITIRNIIGTWRQWWLDSPHPIKICVLNFSTSMAKL